MLVSLLNDIKILYFVGSYSISFQRIHHSDKSTVVFKG